MVHMNIGLRKQGKQFSFNEHIEGLLLSLLSSQRPRGQMTYDITANKHTLTRPETKARRPSRFVPVTYIRL